MAEAASTDRSPRATETHPSPQRAEVSNYEIVAHWFDRAADRLGLRDDIAAVLRLVLPRGAGSGAGQARRRADPRLLRLPRPAQRRARPLQGGHPLPPRGGPRRGAGARLADDLEDRDRRHPLRRRQGRDQRGSAPARAARAPVRLTLVHGQDREGARADARHPGARRGHQRPGDGLAHGRVRQAARTHARVRDRQADRARGLLRARGGHGPRGRVHVPRGRSAPGARPRPRRTFAVQGFGNVGSWAARIMQQLGARMVAVSDASGAIRSDSGIDAEALEAHISGGRHAGGVRREPSGSTPTTSWRWSATCSFPRPSAG